MFQLLILLSSIQLVVAFIGYAKAIDTVGLHQQTPVQYGSQIGPVLYGALGEGGLVSESRTLPDEAGPKMSALPTSGLATVTKSLKPAQPLVYRPNPYVYIPAIGQVAKPEETVGDVEPRTVPEGLKPVATNPFVYTASPYVYAHHMNPVHPNQITPIVPHGLAYSFTSGHASVVKVPKPEETLVNAELRTVEEGVEPVATNPFVYDASPYVYAHPMNPVHPTQIKPVVSHGFAYYGSPDGTIQSRGRTNPVHPTQIKPVVPHGFAYSFTVGNENVAAQRCTCEVHPFCCVF